MNRKTSQYDLSFFNDCVVLITGTHETNFGTGFVFAMSEKHSFIMTCAHVIDDVGGDKIMAKERVAEIVVKGNSSAIDLAVLKVERLPVDTYLSIRLFAETNDIVTVYGFREEGKHISLRSVAAVIGEQAIFQNRSGKISMTAWDIAINSEHGLEPGYSGAPVVDMATQEVIGIIEYRKGISKGIAIWAENLLQIWPDTPIGEFSDQVQARYNIDLLISRRQVRGNSQEAALELVERVFLERNKIIKSELND
ncbi:trypsin-like peptidase domain-containing protein [Candidatus Gracilibacteria bacterium]|nr:trypsin-like peptidase domain-containing protein [Candidatus Gracilibacteria bacterium]